MVSCVVWLFVMGYIGGVGGDLACLLSENNLNN